MIHKDATKGEVFPASCDTYVRCLVLEFYRFSEPFGYADFGACHAKQFAPNLLWHGLQTLPQLGLAGAVEAGFRTSQHRGFDTLVYKRSPRRPSRPPSQIRIQAKRNATREATRPIPGAGKTIDASGLAKIIDDEITLRLVQEKIPSSPRSEDSEFIRRVYLDLVGVIPAG